MSLAVTAAVADPDLLYFPWHLPLEDWPEDLIVALPRGISRHIVRFIRIHGVVHALKEIEESYAIREYELLLELQKRSIPAVEAVAVVSGRKDANNEPLPAVLITRHLDFSLPYRAVFSSTPRPDTASRLLDAMTALFVRLHTVGFSWNDCSLSNTLFRRDAGAFAAYLVDAETGELHIQLSDGQREYDIDTAILNVTGELLDLQYGGKLPDTVDPIALGQSLGVRYHQLWELLNKPVMIEYSNRNQLDAHIRNLNNIGFDISGISMQSIDADRQLVRVQAKVVDVGHHARRLLRLTGLDVEENQARRMLNDLDSFKTTLKSEISEEEVAHKWMLEVYEPVIGAIPRELRKKLEPAEIFHEVLEHRWFLSERAGHSVGIEDVVEDYVANVLPQKPDEAAVMTLDDTTEITNAKPLG
jgi:tRNA A-37 threonylcarbamoyl transferase component Bud32